MSNVGYYLALKENYYSCLPMIYNYFFIRVIRKLCMHLINPVKSNQQNPSHFNSRGLLLILINCFYFRRFYSCCFFFLLRPALRPASHLNLHIQLSLRCFKSNSKTNSFNVLCSSFFDFFPSLQAVVISFVLNQLEFCSSYGLNMYTNANGNIRGTLLPELILDTTSLDTTSQAP